MSYDTPHPVNTGNIIQYSKRCFMWLLSRALTLLILSVPPVLVFYSISMPCDLFLSTEARVRLTGLALQAIGFVFAIWKVLELRAFFGKPNLAEIAKEWLRSFPRWPRTVVVQPHSARIELTGFPPKISVIGPVAPIHDPASVDAKIAQLEREVADLCSRITNVDTQARRENNARREEIEALQHNLRRHKAEAYNSISNVHQLLRTIMTDGHAREVYGVWLFIWGIVASGASPELAEWVTSCDPPSVIEVSVQPVRA